MRYLVALFFPWLSFFTMGKVFQGILCLILQLTIIGWIPATIWAFVSISNYSAEKRTDRIVAAVAGISAPTGSAVSSHKTPPKRTPGNFPLLAAIVFVVIGALAWVNNRPSSNGIGAVTRSVDGAASRVAGSLEQPQGARPQPLATPPLPSPPSVVALPPSSQTPPSETFVFVVCDQSPFPATIATLARPSAESDDWIVQGWAQAYPGGCGVVGTFAKGDFFAAATGPNGQQWGKSDSTQCVRPERFSRAPGGTCQPGEGPLAFQEFHITDDKFTWTLGGAGGASNGELSVQPVPIAKPIEIGRPADIARPATSGGLDCQGVLNLLETARPGQLSWGQVQQFQNYYNAHCLGGGD